MASLAYLAIHMALAGIILAAGESKRMGSPKPLVSYLGKTLLEHAVDSIGTTVAPLLVVVGHEAPKIQAAFPLSTGQYLVNSRYQDGQTSSLQTGIKFLMDNKIFCEGAMVSLVDHPGVTPTVVNQLARIFKQTEPPIALPVFQGHRGHPVIFSASLFQEILDLAPTQGANELLRRYANKVCELSTTDPNITRNINKPEDVP